MDTATVPKIILHLGLEKTGTTSIQATLDANRVALIGQGVLYPVVGAVGRNKMFAAAFDRASEGKGSFVEVVERYGGSRATLREHLMSELRRELADAGDIETLIISSEFLSAHGDMTALKAFFQNLSDTLLPITYMRDPQSLVPSLYSTFLKAGGTEFGLFDRIDAGELPRTLRYDEQAADIVAAFGKQASAFRIFSPSQLHRGDVVADFFDFAGIDMDRIDTSGVAKNKSLSALGMTVLKTLNGWLEDREVELPGLSRQIMVDQLMAHDVTHGSGKFRLSPSRSDALARLTAPHDKAFFETYVETPNGFGPKKPVSSSDSDIAADAESIYMLGFLAHLFRSDEAVADSLYSQRKTLAEKLAEQRNKAKHFRLKSKALAERQASEKAELLDTLNKVRVEKEGVSEIQSETAKKLETSHEEKAGLLAALNEAREKARSDLDDFNERLDASKTERDTLSNALDKVRDERAALADAQSAARTALEETRSDLAEVRSKLDTSQAEKADLFETLKKVQEEKAALTDTQTNFQERLKALHAEKDALLETLNSARDKSQSDLTDLKTRLEASQADKADLLATLNKVREEKDALADAQTASRTTLEETRSNLAELGIKLETSKSEKAELLDALNKVRGEKDGLAEIQSETAKKLETSHEEKAGLLAALNEAREKAGSDLADLTNRLEAHKYDKETLVETLEKLREEKTDLVSAQTASRAALEKHRSDLTDLQKRLEASQADKSDMLEALNKVREEKDALSSAQTTSRAMLEEGRSNLAGLREKLEASQAEKAELFDALKAVREERLELAKAQTAVQGKLDAAHADKSELLSMLNKTRKERDAALAAKTAAQTGKDGWLSEKADLLKRLESVREDKAALAKAQSMQKTKLDIQAAQTNFFRGEYLRLVGDEEAARECYERAAQLDPENDTYSKRLGGD
ncbi:MAG: hypothetical protein WBF53_15500 [Litorimonas sp.]